MPLPLHGHRRRPPLPRRRAHGVSSVLATSPHRVGCLILLLLLALVVLAAFLLHGASSSSARSSHHHREETDGRSAPPSITIFSVPLRPPEGSPARQELAVRSWLALPGDVTVVLLGSHPSALALAERLGRRVTVEASIDSSFTGTPFFHSMLARAQAAGTGICVLVDAEIVLLPETATLLTDLSRIHRDWLLVSASRNISSHRYNLANDGIEPSFKMLEEIQAGNWAADSSDRGLVFAWNNPGSPLLAGVVPSFLYGRGAHNRWLAHEVLSSQMRLVFDASSLVLGLYPEDFSAKIGMGSSSRGRLPGGSWEFGVNRHLALVYGSYCYHPPGGLHSPMLYEVLKHSEDYMLSKVEEPTFSRFFIGDKEQNVNSWNKEDNFLSDHLRSYSSEASDVPYSLETLLRFVADGNRSVVLGVAGSSYRDMLMSWVCRLRHLGVTNFVVCALDKETYEFSILQGLPVFRDPSSPKNVSFDDCHYGTQCFKRVTKVKSRIVLKILRMRYNVLLSDVDVYWFRNPVNFLYSLGPATFAAQSDEYNETGPINLPRRLNSGFYYARSDNATIAAMEMVVEHATKSNSSEQPSFYDVMCGKEGANRLSDDTCLEPSTNLTIVFLDRDLFPNGAYKGLWERNNVRSACRKLGCFIIHNNWVHGRVKKLQRQMASGLWDYDPSSRMCLQNWSEATNFRIVST